MSDFSPETPDFRASEKIFSINRMCHGALRGLAPCDFPCVVMQINTKKCRNSYFSVYTFYISNKADQSKSKDNQK